MAGILQDPASDSGKLFEELCRRGYDIVPVNPNASEVHGRRCFARVQDIQPPVEAALLMTSPEATETVVHDCAETGIRRVWMYRGTGKGSVSAKAIAVSGRNMNGHSPDNVSYGNHFSKRKESTLADHVSNYEVRSSQSTHSTGWVAR